MELNYDSFWFVLLVTIGIIFLSLAIFFGLKIAYSSDSEDPAGWCLRHEYPYNILCMQFERERLMLEINKNLEILLNRSAEWDKTIPYP